MMILVTGGAGFLGAWLARTLLEQGKEVATFDIKPASPVVQSFEGSYTHFQGNIGNMGELLTVVGQLMPSQIYHFGGMLSMPSEQNPQACFSSNVVGMFNVLESARAFEVKQVLYASTNGTFGLDLEGLEVINDRTLQRPFTMYGCSKVFGELLGRYYKRRYGIDFRSIRLPAVVGPGAKNKNVSIYNCWAIEKSYFGEAYDIFVTPETVCPVIYFKDAVLAFLKLAAAPLEQIKTMNYIVVGVDPMPSADALAETIKRYLPQANLGFVPDKLAMDFHQMSQGVRWDESPAVAEWGWRCSYDLDRTVNDFIKELADHPKWYD